MTIANSKIADPKVSWKAVPAAPHLRYCAAHRLIAWQPHRVLDDRLLARIDAWLLVTEDISPPCKRFIDFSCLTNVSLPIGRAFAIAPAARDKSHAVPPVKCAFFCDKPLGFAIARLYETLTNNPSMEARAFRDRATAAKWLEVPAHILQLGQALTAFHSRRARLTNARYVPV
jgi:hypothetical protein